MKKIILAILGALGMGHSNAENVPDYSHVDSQEKVIQLAQDGLLFKILLFPEELGGQDVPPNIVYVPAGIPEIKGKLTGTLLKFAQDGLIDNLQVNPEYKGSSFVPSKITMKTSHSGKAGEFNPTIEIW